MDQDFIDSPINLKGEMNMQNILHIHSTDAREILHALAKKRDEAPQFFLRTPLSVDCKAIEMDSEKLDFTALMKGIRALSFVPIGIRHLSEEALQLAMDAGWAILRASKAKQVAIKSKPAEKAPEIEQEQNPANTDENAPVVTEVNTNSRLKVITRPVRSGQQVYSSLGDVVVLSQTGAGSEVLADGSIHVYGSISGRVLAGVNGDRSARIFCQSLDAELIAIAGIYQLLDEVDTPLKGQPAMISLEGDKLKIEAMV